jgi:hypothetical protein
MWCEIMADRQGCEEYCRGGEYCRGVGSIAGGSIDSP